MKSLLLVCVVAVLLGLTGAANAALDFNLWTLVGHNSSAAIDPGTSIDLLVQMDTDEPITAVVLNVLLPVEGWTRDKYELSDYGWFEDDGVFDNSTPAGSTTSRVIDNNSWLDALYPNSPDFKFDTSYNPLTASATGNGVNFAAFRLTIPNGTAPGPYNIGIRHASALNADTGDEPTAQDSNFSLRVNGGDVPEPGTLGLALVGLAGLGLLRKRRA